MMRKLFLLPFSVIVLAVAIAGASSTSVSAVDPFAESSKRSFCTITESGTFFGFPKWFKYLKGEDAPTVDGESVCRPTLRTPNDLWLVVAAVFEMLLQLAGIAAVAFVIWGGITYITGRGQPDKIAQARDTIINAVTGLIITVMAARIVGFIAGRFSGSSDSTFLLPNVSADSGALSTILSVVFQLVGALAVIFVVYGGITYARANGDPGTIKEAKNTIMYALIGLAVAIFAQAIVLFVFDRLA